MIPCEELSAEQLSTVNYISATAEISKSTLSDVVKLSGQEYHYSLNHSITHILFTIWSALTKRVQTCTSTQNFANIHRH